MTHNLSHIAIDWGTSNFRAWLIDKDNHILSFKESDKGLLFLQQNKFESYLYQQIKDWYIPDLPIIMCGMVGSQKGWQEVPYIPFSEIMLKLPSSLAQVPNTQGFNIRIVAGCSLTNKHFDVMRGEETQTYGFLCENPNYTGLLCLPGTHSKWVICQDGIPLTFYSFLTGELFNILSKYSILSSMLRDSWDDASFRQGVNKAISNPALFSHFLFGIRAQSLLEEQSLIDPTSFLSGLSIGLELSAMQSYIKEYQNITFIGNAKLMENYQKAINIISSNSQQYDTTTATLMGIYYIVKSL
ncbi:MAG: 2-dehydro-3-deoxygalactonokinase [Alphaproteobacteria bacterium]